MVVRQLLNVIYKIRGYGLWCEEDGMWPNGVRRKRLDPNDYKDAVELMWREIKLVIDECVGCTPTDIYIAAALAQNGPGFNLVNMKELAKPGKRINGPTLWGGWLRVSQQDVKVNWDRYFGNPGNADDTQRHLILFDGVIKELQKRNWYLPDVNWTVVDYLKTIGD